MATLQALSLSLPSLSRSSRSRFHASSLHQPKNVRMNSVAIPKLPSLITMEELRRLKEEDMNAAGLDGWRSTSTSAPHDDHRREDLVAKLFALAEAAADRVEKHAIIAEQRSNWNILLLNSITLTASIMAGISAIPVADEATSYLLAFKLSSALLFTAATGLMMAVNKIQPSQLFEEQVSAVRLFKKMERWIQTTLRLDTPTEMDVDEAMERILALDKAYPLPLMPEMLEKFPKKLEPTKWWPQSKPRRHGIKQQRAIENNGWSEELEEEMMGVVNVLKLKDEEKYVSFGDKVLKFNKILAVSGPLLAGVAALGTGLIGSSGLGPWPALVGVLGGTLATIVNTVEHGGQVGMVFELCRNSAGHYRHLQEMIRCNLEERDVTKREDAELFEMKMALELGRSLSELRSLAAYASPSTEAEDIEGFGGKLF